VADAARVAELTERGSSILRGLNRSRAATLAAWVAAIPFAGWAAIRVFGLDGGYPLEAMMPFTPYVGAAATVAAALALALRRRAPAALALVAALALGAVVLPRQIGDGTVSAAGHRTLSVLAANVHEGGADPAALVHLVDAVHAEVLTVEEFTPRFARELAAAGLGSRLRYRVLDAEPRAQGTAIYSRCPLRRLPTAPFVFKMARAEASLPGGRRLRIVAVHPIPPRHSSWVPEWEEVMSTLPSGGRGTPWLLAGDFNATLDQAPFRELVGRGYRDAGEVAGKGLDATFPATGSIFPPPITIDHILADERFGIVGYEVEPLPGSDHRAIFAELALPDR
jgi:endonuclease/exonuclease/phosphatase (EEP) superfamily protein YafD